MSDEKIGITTTFKDYIEHARETMPEDAYDIFLSSIVGGIKWEIQEIDKLPEGSTRAKIIHYRIDKAITSFFKRNPKAKKAVSCFGCTQSGCCHTNVDITSDEAELYAELVERGLKIDLERLERQAAVPDGIEERFKAWGTLSFEERRCVFLSDEGRCRIYENRPFVCRKWHVQADPSTCADYNGGGMIQIVQFAEIIASAAFSKLKAGRLPKMLKAAIEKRKNKK